MEKDAQRNIRTEETKIIWQSQLPAGVFKYSKTDSKN